MEVPFGGSKIKMWSAFAKEREERCIRDSIVYMNTQNGRACGLNLIYRKWRNLCAYVYLSHTHLSRRARARGSGAKPEDYRMGIRDPGNNCGPRRPRVYNFSLKGNEIR